MTIDELRSAKVQLDADLTELVSKRVAKFERETGLTLDRIEVHLSSMQTLCSNYPTRFGDCTVETGCRVF